MQIVTDIDYSLKKVFFVPFGISLFFGLLALGISGLYFPKVMEMTACALFAVSLSSFLNTALETNRIGIWEKQDSPFRVNKKLALEFTAIFAGMFVAASLLQILAPKSFLPEVSSIEEAFRNEFWPLYKHNLFVLMACILIAFLYRAGGLAIILSWNAIHWSTTLTVYLLHINENQGFVRSATVGVALLPHLILEVIGYVLAGMAGTFFSKGLFKYSLSSLELHRVSWACVVLLISSLILLLLGNTSEIYLAQPVFHPLY